MFISSVSIKGFLTFRDETTIDVAKGTTAVVGPNGSGKSSVQQAIQWCLTGESRIPNDAQSVINNNSNSAKVVVFFTHNAKEYKVIRERNKSGVSLEAYKKSGSKWVNITSGRSVKNLQEHILANVLSTNVDTLQSLMFIDQKGEGSRFTGAKPEDRRSILISMIPELSRWDKYHKKLSDQLTLSNKELVVLTSKLEAHTENLVDVKLDVGRLSEFDSATNIDVLRKNLEIANNNLQSSLGGIDNSVTLKESIKAAQNIRNAEERIRRSKRESIRDDYNDLVDIADEIDEIETKAVALNEELSKISQEKEILFLKRDSHSDEMNQIDEDIVSLEKEKTHFEFLLQKLEDEIAELEVRLEALSNTQNGKCSVCSSPLDEEQIDSIKKSTSDSLRNSVESAKVAQDGLVRVNSLLNSKNSQKKNVLKDLQSADYDIQNIKSKETMFKVKIAAIPEEKGNLADKASGISGVMCSPYNISSLIDKLVDDKFAEHQNYVIDVPKTDEEIALEEMLINASKNSPEIAKAREAKKVAEDNLTNAIGVKAELEAMSAKMGKLSKKVHIVQLEYDTEFARNKRIKVLREASSPKGVPSTLIASLLSQIVSSSNEFMDSILGKNSMSISFALEKKIKSGARKPSLDIYVTSAGHTKPIESLSGGELAAVTLSIMFSMIKVVNNNGPKLVESIFLDEAFAALDKDKVDPVISTMNSVVDDSDIVSAFIVTHNNDIEFACDRVLHFPLTSH